MGFCAPNVGVYPMHKTLLAFLIVWISFVMVHSKD